jgi:hypothetical protein
MPSMHGCPSHGDSMRKRLLLYTVSYSVAVPPIGLVLCFLLPESKAILFIYVLAIISSLVSSGLGTVVAFLRGLQAQWPLRVFVLFMTNFVIFVFYAFGTYLQYKYGD